MARKVDVIPLELESIYSMERMGICIFKKINSLEVKYISGPFKTQELANEECRRLHFIDGQMTERKAEEMK